MNLREAQSNDIPQLHSIRTSVKENILSDPDLITINDYEEFLLFRGKGWVSEIENRIVGFAVVDLKDNNIWALFIHPDFEKKGIGKALQDLMLNWYFTQTNKTVWLSTSPNTRAELFYRRSGWNETGIYGKDEIKFEMSWKDWSKLKNQ